MSDSSHSRAVVRPPEGSGTMPADARNSRVIHGDLAQIAGQPWTHALFWFVLAAAAGVDIVTFHQVLLLAVNETDLMLWTAVVGFTVVALTLGHYMGIQARHSTNPRNVVGARPTAWICFGVWLLLGVTAFVFRYIVAEPVATSASTFVVDGAAQPDLNATADHSAQHLSALLFLTLYVGTGTISGLAGFVRHNAAAKQYNRAVTRRTQAARRHAYSRAVHAAADELWLAIERVGEQQEAHWRLVEDQCTDTAARLKQQARLHLLAVRRPDSGLPAALSQRPESLIPHQPEGPDR